MKESKTTGLNKKRILLPLVFVLAAVVIIFTRGISARYVLQAEKNVVAEAASFYFTSDLLKEENENADYTIDSLTKSFDIELYNWADALRVTAQDITYTVTVEGGTASPGGSGTYTSEPTMPDTPAPAMTGTLKVNTEAPPSDSGTAVTKTTDKITITPGDSAKDITVTAKSTAPYEKTLKATFHIAPGNQYTVKDGYDYTAAVLDIICTDIASGDAAGPSSIVIKLPENVIPDATDSRVKKNNNAVNSYTFAMEENGIYSLVLLKLSKGTVLSGANVPFINEIDLTKSAAS